MTFQNITNNSSSTTQANENFDAVAAAGTYGKRAPGVSGLTLAFYGGRGFGNTIADGTVTLTASATNYVVANRSTGAVSVSTATTNWNDSANYYRVRLIVTGTSSITSDTDYREFTGGGGGGVSDPFIANRAHIGSGSYNANSIVGDDEHLLEVTNDPSVITGVGTSGKQLLRINSYGVPGYGGNVHFCRYRGTEASPSAVQSGDTFMSFGMRGWDSSAALSQSAASFAAVATENWTGSAHGIKFVWQVTPNGSTTRGNGMELSSTGLAVTGTVSATVAVSSPASATGSAGLKVPHGAAPTSPVDGDVWTTSAGMYVRVSGVTVGPLASSAGAGTAWGTITGTLSSQTDLQAALDAKQARSPAIQSVTSASTVTPTFLNDMVKITAQAAALTLANPTGTAIDGLGIVIRIKDNGTARAISYGTQYRAIGVTLPTTTTVSKTLYMAMVFNNDDTKWDVVAVGVEP